MERGDVCIQVLRRFRSRLSVLAKRWLFTLPGHPTTIMSDSLYRYCLLSTLFAPGLIAQPTNVRAGRAIVIESQAYVPYPGHGGAVVVVRTEFEAPATQKTPPVDSGITINAVQSCTTTRPCASGWDLRVASVEFQPRRVTAGTRTSARIVVENRGRSAAEPSIVALCWGEATECEEPVARLALPALASGASAVLAVPVTVEPRRGTVIRATIDPGRTTGETGRANNSAQSAPLQVALPELQIATLEVPPTVRAKSGVLPVTLSIRNKSRVDATPMTEVQFSRQTLAACGTSELGGGMARLDVPALAPGQQWTAVLRIQHEGVSCSIAAETPLVVTVDPDERIEWGSKHEKTAERTYLTKDR